MPLIFLFSPCDFCKQVLCKTCSEISATEIRALVLSTRVLPFICKKCVSKLKDAVNVTNRVSSLECEVTKVKSQLQSMSDLGEVVKQISSELLDLKTILQTSFTDLRDEMKAMKSEVSDPTIGNSSLAKLRCGTDNEIMQEMNERQKRSSNIMLFNLPEVDEETDSRRANTIISSIAGEQLALVTLARIGRRNKNGHRSLRVTLQNQGDVLKVLKNKRRIDKSEGVFIEADLTSQQRSHLNELKNELKRRQRSGESGLTLKYVGGVPRIISKN